VQPRETHSPGPPFLPKSIEYSERRACYTLMHQVKEGAGGPDTHNLCLIADAADVRCTHSFTFEVIFWMCCFQVCMQLSSAQRSGQELLAHLWQHFKLLGLFKTKDTVRHGSYSDEVHGE
jgi:hypothetical protein